MAVLHGTTGVVTDPHEIANVCGINGIKYMLQATEGLPIDVFFNVPSCVPATPFDESAYTLSAQDVEKCFDLDEKRIVGLAEMMNYPGVIYEDPEVLAKLAEAKLRGKRIDGHAPGLTGEDLEKYIGAGIESDHECSTLEEASEKLRVAKRLGVDFKVIIREGTAAKNLEALWPLINDPEFRDNIMFGTDDKHPEEIKKQGHIDHIIRKAISLGANVESAYIAATYNAAQHFGLNNCGEIAIGNAADLVVLDDERTVKINSVYKNGEEITVDRLSTWEEPQVNDEIEAQVKNSINMREFQVSDIACKGKAKQVIGLIPGQIITEDAGAAKDYDLENDIIKMVVIESHKGTMHTGIAYLKGMGLKKGAIGTTVAHDSHYMILAGTNDEDIVRAANELRNMQGGKIYVEDGKVKAKLQLEIAGLMTEANPMKVINDMEKLKDLADVKEGIDAFMNLSFNGLAVIGDIRLLSGGPFDVRKWGFLEDKELEEKWEKQQEKNANPGLPEAPEDR